VTAEAWVYLLRCADGSLYTGWTVDLERRIARHAARTAARREEARIKALPRADKVALVQSASSR
jgi:predicted GIY-YIG superfamily endonuclease